MEANHIQPLSDPQLSILAAARQHVSTLSAQNQDVRLVFHNDFLGDFLETEVEYLAKEEQTDLLIQYHARLAALFYPLGYNFDFNLPLRHSKNQAQQWLQAKKEPEVTIQAVMQIMDGLSRNEKTPATLLLKDALTSLKIRTETHAWPDLEQLEKELFNHQMPRLDAAQLQLQELLNARFYTASARQKWQGALGKAMVEQKRKVNKLKRIQPERNNTENTNHSGLSPYQGIENGVPVRAAQTYFRAIYRNHINLSAIADNKANIMISVNSILISVLITFLSYRNIAETQPIVLFPVVIFLVAGLASLVFAVLSARPKVTVLNTPLTSVEDRKKNMIFFGNFIHLRLEEYELIMDEILRDGSLMYGNMVRDLFHLGKVLDKKYRFLTMSYNIFMVGLIITVALFLLTLF